MYLGFELGSPNFVIGLQLSLLRRSKMFIEAVPQGTRTP